MHHFESMKVALVWECVILYVMCAFPVYGLTNSGTPDRTKCYDATAKQYACLLLAAADAGKMTLWHIHPSGVKDDAYAYNNVNDTCHGYAAARSNYTCSTCRDPGAPGGFVCIQGNLLVYIYKVYQHFGTLHVNEIAGACHSCRSKHYQGRAVDLDNPGDTSVYMLKLCTDMDGWSQNEGNHVHCQLPVEVQAEEEKKDGHDTSNSAVTSTPSLFVVLVNIAYFIASLTFCF